MQLSHAWFLTAIVLTFSCIFATYYGFFMITTKFTDTTQSNLLDQDNKSWFDQKSKVIMVLVDGFRYDYIAYNESLVGHEIYPYQNRLKKLHEIATKSPECFTLLQARSDPPTWTLAKVPGLVTGNIYPKTGILQAVYATQYPEDSVLHHVRMEGKKAYFAGDPMWAELFPEDFVNVTRARGLDIKDIEVDAEIMDSVRYWMKEDNFDIIIAHMLGVDHAGHWLGLSDPLIGKQLDKIDQYMTEIIESMDDNTMLIMLGDHGMTPQGTHGTDTYDETHTMIAAYHKKGFQKYQDKVNTPAMRSVNETLQQVKQQDLAPTLSMLLGVPIPFSNFGQILNDLYPTGELQKQEGCQGATFSKKMLDDNYLNTLQVMHYYNLFTDNTELLSEEVYQSIQSLSEEAISAYQEARALAKNDKNCPEPSFADKTTNAIVLGQKLSDKIGLSILTSQDYNMFMIIEGMITTILILIAYILIIQYLYSSGYERQHDKIKNLGRILRGFIVPGIIISLILLITWIRSKSSNFAMASLANVMVFVAFWLLKSLLTHLFANGFKETQSSITDKESQIKPENEKQKELSNFLLDLNYVTFVEEANNPQSEDYETVSSPTKSELGLDETKRFTFFSFLKGLRSIFFFQTPLISILALIITISLIIVIHQSFFDSSLLIDVKDYSPFVVFLVLGFRIGSLLTKRKTYFLTVMALYIIFSLIIIKSDLIDFESLEVRIVLGLVLVADWIISETKYVQDKFKARQVWAYIHLLCFLVLVIYQMIEQRDSYLVGIILPRIVWVLIIGLCVLKNIFKVHGLGFMRNLQLCLVHFLLLLTSQKNVLPFAIAITLMKITAHLASKYFKPSNYLYPFLIMTESFFTFYFLGQHDRSFPSLFTAGFVGLHDFNPVLSVIMIVMNYMTAFILGMMFISYYNQSIDLQTLDLDQVSPSVESEEMPAKSISKVTARIMKKRNAIFFIFLIAVVYFGAFIKCFMLRNQYFEEEGARFKYMIDSSIYMFLMTWGGVILAFE